MPVNAFFGATLCSVDVNNDGLDDLFVGAPMLSQPSTKDVELIEEGAVFVFLGGEKVKLTGHFPIFGYICICVYSIVHNVEKELKLKTFRINIYLNWNML